ncbi:A24 family peptidase [Methylogaea oryzae]|uniref:A24 family peptidase n=1 Tax=Methylogaea oryzae TaxID=1295382 RepID=UPI0006CF2660|nr:A24 family peptidase [Methylogaea oryzae]
MGRVRSNILFCTFMALGVIYDVFTRRIPNWLNGIGLCAALLSAGLIDQWQSVTDAGLGMGAGLLALLPLYAFASMGAGDVKMMAVVGAFVGAAKVLLIAAVSVTAAAVASVAVILVRGELPALCRRYGAMLTHMVVAQEVAYLPPRQGDWAGKRVAFAPAIAVGAIVVVFWRPDWLPFLP